MKLGSRVLGLLAGLTTILLCVLYFVAHTVVSRGFGRIERDLAIGNALRVLNAVRSRAENLNASVADWSRWDATYRFVRDGNREFVTENLVESTFKGLKIDLLLIADLQGGIKWGGASSPPGAPIRAPTTEQRRLLAPGTPLTRFDAAKDHCAGVVLTRSGPMVVSSQPILKSSGGGPSRGTLLMGRLLNADAVARIGEDLDLLTSAHVIGSPRARDILSRLGARLDVTRSSPAVLLGRNTMVGFAVMRDVYGKPALLLEATADRAVHRQGLSTAYLFGGLLTLGCLLYAIVLGMWLRAHVLRRVESLSAQVSRVEASGASANVVQVSGSDELAALAQGISGMLERLDGAQRQTDEARRQFETLFNELPEGCAVHEMIFDESGAPVDYRFELVNAAFESITGMKAADLVGRRILEIMPATEQFWIDTYGKVVLTGEATRFEHYSGVLNRYYRVAAFRPSPGRFACVVSDISDSKATEERIQKLLDDGAKSRTALLSLLEDQRRAAAALSAREQEARRLLQQQTQIAELALELSESHDLTETYRTLHRHARALVEVSYFAVSSYDEADRRIRVVYAATEDREHDVSEFPPLTVGGPGADMPTRVIDTGEVVCTPDQRHGAAGASLRSTVERHDTAPSEEPSEAVEADSTGTTVYLPMRLKGRVTGIIQIQSKRANAYTERDIEILKVVASVGAVADRNAHLRADLLHELDERTRAEAQARRHLDELQRWQDVVLGREDRVQELKREVNDLCRRVDEPIRYPSEQRHISVDGTAQDV